MFSSVTMTFDVGSYYLNFGYFYKYKPLVKLMPSACFKQKTGKCVACSKNTGLEHSAGKQFVFNQAPGLRLRIPGTPVRKIVIYYKNNLTL